MEDFESFHFLSFVWSGDGKELKWIRKQDTPEPFLLSEKQGKGRLFQRQLSRALELQRGEVSKGKVAEKKGESARKRMT